MNQTGDRKTEDKWECNERTKKHTHTRIDHSEVHEQRNIQINTSIDHVLRIQTPSFASKDERERDE